MKIVIIDNFDSFTNNIAHYLEVSSKVDCVSVLKNNDTSHEAQNTLNEADAIVLSPGPGNVNRPSDLGICENILCNDERPILGICLGQQAIAYFSGATVRLAKEPVHGRDWLIRHTADGLFFGLANPLKVVRYHSWIVDVELPPEIQVTAWADDEIMAIEHTTLPRWGVQFHPESIGTEGGHQIFENFIELTLQRQTDSAHRASIRPMREFSLRELTYKIDLVNLMEALRLKGKSPVLLESAMIKDGLSRFSYIGADFGIQFENVFYYQATKTAIVSRAGQADRSFKTNLSEFLWSDISDIRHVQPPPEFQFLGGLIGWCSYELQEEFAGIKTSPKMAPDAAFVRVNSFFVFDHILGKVYAAVSLPVSSDKVAWDILNEMDESAVGSAHVAELRSGHLVETVVFHPRHNDQVYLELIEKCKAKIGLGESYELCLTNEITASAEGVDPWELYLLLRRKNSCPHAAYLEIGDTIVVSSSPERFLSVDRDGYVEAKPIKGTIRRGRTEKEDDDLKDELKKSVKDRAENLMIVDLLRHDVSEVCIPGTVSAPSLMAIETYPKVHQMVSTVSGQLSEGRLGIEAFTACFPGGSMTGAPKFRSMEILQDLEAGPRGVYSGSIGWIGYDGALDQSIVIRTVVFQREKLSIGCGGAITYLSEPTSELDEVKLKAGALLNCVAEVATGDANNYELQGGGLDDSKQDRPANDFVKVI